jgi:hypothetical protein
VARKRRKVEREEAISIPEFDEVEYMRKEVEGARVAIITILVSVPFAFLAFLLTKPPVNEAGLGFLAGIAGVVSLRYVYPIFRIPTDAFGRKEWFGNGMIFFFSWLAIWVLLVNPPFTDITPPVLIAVGVNGVDVPLANTAYQLRIPVGEVVIINATVTDNVAVESVTVQVDGGPAQPMAPADGAASLYERNLGTFDQGTYTVRILAKDAAGLTTSYTFRLAVTP